LIGLRNGMGIGGLIGLLFVGCNSSTPESATALPGAATTEPSENVEPKTGPPGTDRGQTAQSIEAGENVRGSAIPDPDTLYESWPKPDLVLFITGQQHGYIEPCGCTGLENQKGGMARRHKLIEQLTNRGWPLVAVDAGNQVRRFGRQAEIKFQVTADALSTMGYEAVTLGPEDFQLSSGVLVATTAEMDDQVTPFLCANAAVLDRSLTPTHKFVERNGKKIGITAVIGDEWLGELQSGEILGTPARDALEAVLPKLREADCDITVLLAQATVEESRELGKEFPELDVVICAGGEGDPAFQPERIGDDGPLLVRVGEKGMHVGLIALFDGTEPRFRYQRIPLASKFKDSDEMLQLLTSYQKLLEFEGLDGLGVRAQPHPTGRKFVGSTACAECHSKAYKIWKESPHFVATDSLVNPPNTRSEIPRHFDPECLSCHVTGWNPQRFYPYQSGYLGREQSPLMHGSGCENCHGPGSEHVSAESGDASDELLERLREGMQLPLSKAKDHCMQCHDLDNDPHFIDEGAFENDYWPQVEH
jgi:hypothetical protein